MPKRLAELLDLFQKTRADRQVNVANGVETILNDVGGDGDRVLLRDLDCLVGDRHGDHDDLDPDPDPDRGGLNFHDVGFACKNDLGRGFDFGSCSAVSTTFLSILSVTEIWIVADDLVLVEDVEERQQLDVLAEREEEEEHCRARKGREWDGLGSDGKHSEALDVHMPAVEEADCMDSILEEDKETDSRSLVVDLAAVAVGNVHLLAEVGLRAMAGAPLGAVLGMPPAPAPGVELLGEAVEAGLWSEMTSQEAFWL